MSAVAIKVPDHELDTWAERFIAEGLSAVMTFEDYMSLTPALRERRGRMLLAADASMSRRIDGRHAIAEQHGVALIEPIHHGVREFRRPWFRNNRNHV